MKEHEALALAAAAVGSAVDGYEDVEIGDIDDDDGAFAGFRINWRDSAGESIARVIVRLDGSVEQ